MPGPQPTHRFDRAAWRRRLAVAKRESPADLLLRGAQIVNVFSGELERANIALSDGRIAAVGDYDEGRAVLDVSGRIVAPSFIDAHLHLESSLVWTPEFARAVVPHGTGGVITDPHEIANVAGLAGIDAFRAATRGLPLHIRFTIPSGCKIAHRNAVYFARMCWMVFIQKSKFTTEAQGHRDDKSLLQFLFRIES